MPLLTYTIRAIRAAQLAGRRAARAGAAKVEPEHLLMALLGEKQLAGVFTTAAIDSKSLAPAARELANATILRKRTRPRLSRRMEAILKMSQEQAQLLAGRSVDVQHLLMAMIREGGPAAALLAGHGATYETMRRAVRSVFHIAPPKRCPACGYDLRATPERCPECGSTV